MANKILISNSLPDESRALIPAGFEVDYNPSDLPWTKPELIGKLEGKTGLICHIISTLDDEVFAACPGLKVVSNVAVGFNNIDVAAAKKRGIVVTNTPDVLTETTADFAWALLMAAARQVVPADRYVRSGEWQAWKWDLLWGRDIHGKTLGVVGFGRIGRAVARRAQGFGMRILYHDTVAADSETERSLNASRVEMGTLLQESDFVSLHTLLSAATRHLIDESALRQMKRTAILVNASRGPVVDEAALVKALSEGWIAAAGLDVFENEPKIHPGLIPLSNVVLAPHIGSASGETRVAMGNLAVRNCVAVLEGKPPITPV